MRQVETQSSATLLRQSFDIIIPQEGDDNDAVLKVDDAWDYLDTEKSEDGGGIIHFEVSSPHEIALRTGGEGRTTTFFILCFCAISVLSIALIYRKRQQA